MSSSFDYSKLMESIIKITLDTTNMLLIEGDTVGKVPDYPFSTFSIISPRISITTDITTREFFECVISITCHSLSTYEALNMSELLRKSFESFEQREILRSNGIVVVKTTNVSNRNNFISIDYERLTGFDLRLRVQDSYEEAIPEIENIELNLGGTIHD